MPDRTAANSIRRRANICTSQLAMSRGRASDGTVSLFKIHGYRFDIDITQVANNYSLCYNFDFLTGNKSGTK